MPTSTPLAETDARSLLRLVAKVAILDGDLPNKKRALLDGLAELVAADAWMWVVSVADPQTGEPEPISMATSGLDEKWVIDNVTKGWDADPNARDPDLKPLAAAMRPGQIVTRSREQVVSDEEWYGHPHVTNYRIPSGVDHYIASLYLHAETFTVSGIGLHRRPGREPFTDRERRMAHIVSSEVRWLHLASLPGQDERETLPTLRPRLRRVLMLLVQGMVRKEIAMQLGISPNTVHGYMKEIYELFGVSSHAELMSRFLSGNGGDVD
jgi:DNA-binding CsgD family transcriptional regulator